MKFELYHADTCLSGYWSGHHRAHIAIQVWHGMTLKQIKDSLEDELRQGAIAGNERLAYLLSSDFVSPEEEKDIDDDCESVYAYFVFMPLG